MENDSVEKSTTKPSGCAKIMVGVDYSSADLYWHAKKMIDWAKDSKYSKDEAIALIEKSLDEDYKEVLERDYPETTHFIIQFPYSKTSKICNHIAGVKTVLAERLQMCNMKGREFVKIKVIFPRQSSKEKVQ